MRRRANDLYFEWLCSKADRRVSNSMQDDFSISLLRTLHDKEFYWTVPNDDNRCSDGEHLRTKFEEETGFDTYGYLDKPCSMLEMLVALAIRFEDAMYEPGTRDRTSVWFWEMCENAGLLDAYLEREDCDELTVDDILNRILERTYKRNGAGGLFPLRDTDKDQRNVELWYQMSAYLLENYYSNDVI